MFTNLLNSSYYDKRPRPIVYQYDSFRLYGAMFQEAYDRSRTWKLLSPEEWVTGAKGGPSMFLTEPGKPSKRLLEVGAFSAVATIGFDALATIDTIDIEVQLPRVLSDDRLDELVRRTSERLCAEFWEGDADLDSFVPDRLEIDWFGLSVLMEVERGDEPEMTIAMRSPKAELARAA